MEPAERLDRFWAALIDRAIFLPILIVPAILFPNYKDRRSAAILLGGLCAVLVLAFIAVQVWLLTTKGQTIGKKARGIRIALVADDSNGGFVVNVLLRGVLTLVLSAIPIAGPVFALADILFIFKEDRRCLHDLIAGTRVVKA